ncbi:MAG: hypothetical protein R3F56_26005 [Planctomycetota bacterium]
MQRARLRLSLLLSLLVPAAAQTATPDRIVGWSEASGPALFNGVQAQSVADTCPPASILCRSLLGSSLFYAGGTAYDPRHDAVWITTGATVQEIELATCTVRCQFTAQLMNANAVVSGLAVLDGGRRLLQLETTPGYLGLRSYDTTACPPTPLRDGCSMMLPPGAVAAGLAVDPASALVLYSVSTPTALDWDTEVLVARDSDRCTPLCRVVLARCGPFYPRSGVVTGLAYDPCGRRLYATNGKHTQGLLVRDPFHCDFERTWCCPTGSNWDYKGLAVAPVVTANDVGRPCAPPQCRPCPAVATLAGGAPIVGNPDFALGVEGAEVGSRAVLVLGAGPCTSGATFPFLCGPLHPSLQPLPYLSPPLPVLGPGIGCVGRAQLDFGVPLAPSLCGATLCAQWVIACPTAVQVLAMSSALEFVLR